MKEATDATGVLPQWPGLVHLVALPPLDMLADLRILMVHAPSYLLFLLGAALSLAVRVTVLAMMLGSLSKPRFKPAILLYLAALPFYLLGAAAFGAALTTIFYVVFWSAIVGSALVFLFLAALPWLARPRSKVIKSGFRAGTLLAYLGLLVLVGTAAELGGPVAAILLIPVSAAFTFTAATLLKHGNRFKLPRRALTALTTGVAAYFAVLVLMHPGGPVEQWPDIDSPRPGSLFIMSGIDSRSGLGVIFELNPPLLEYTCAQTYYFSYGGPGEGQPQNDAPCPLRTGAPYGPSDTLRSADGLVPFFHEQTTELSEPVVVLAERLPRDVRVLSVPSAFDLPLLPADWRIAGTENAGPVPVLHPDLPYAEELRDIIVRFLHGDEVNPCPAWRTIIGPLSRSFGVPPNVDAWGALPR